MPIYYTLFGPVDTIKYSKVYGYQDKVTSVVKKHLHNNLTLLQKYISEQSGYSFDTKPLTLPVFSSYDEAVSACQLLNRPFNHFVVALIDIPTDQQLTKANEFYYPFITSDADKNKEPIAYFPVIKQPCFLIAPEKLNVNSDKSKKDLYRVVSLRTESSCYDAWDSSFHRNTRHRPENYEYYWNYANAWTYFSNDREFTIESKAKKIARLFRNYANPLSQTVGRKASASLAVSFFEKALTCHLNRDHSVLALQIAEDLEGKLYEEGGVAELIVYLVNKINAEKASKGADVFDDNGSFIGRVNFVLTQLTDGKKVDYNEIDIKEYQRTISSKFQDKTRYRSLWPA